MSQAKSMYYLQLRGDMLKKILNGSITTLPEPMFFVSGQIKKSADMIKLWEVTAPYRQAHAWKISYFRQNLNLK